MKTNGRAWLVLAGLVFATAGASAQQPLAADQVSGATLQLWLDQKVAYAGFLHGPGCYFMNSGGPAGERVIYFTCPGGNTKTLQGKAWVAGNEWCSSFPHPAGDECVTWHALPDGAFAQKLRGVTSTTVHLLSVVPMKAAAR